MTIEISDHLKGIIDNELGDINEVPCIPKGGLPVCTRSCPNFYFMALMLEAAAIESKMSPADAIANRSYTYPQLTMTEQKILDSILRGKGIDTNGCSYKPKM